MCTPVDARLVHQRLYIVPYRDMLRVQRAMEGGLARGVPASDTRFAGECEGDAMNQPKVVFCRAHGPWSFCYIESCVTGLEPLIVRSAMGTRKYRKTIYLLCNIFAARSFEKQLAFCA